MEQIKTYDTSTFKIIHTITNEQIQKEKEKENGKDFKLNNLNLVSNLHPIYKGYTTAHR